MLTEYIVGIRFQPLRNPDRIEDATISIKHWVLVFTPALDPTSCRVVELFQGKDHAIIMHTTDLNESIEAQPLASYTGILSDTDAILRAHPMRGSLYSASFNNCQHFAATFLLLLQAFASNHKDRSYSDIDLKLVKRVNSVLSRSGTQQYHTPNRLLETTQLVPSRLIDAVNMALTAMTVIEVAQTVSASAAPVSGLLGWLGLLTTASAAVTSATMTSTMVPIVTGVGFLIEIGLSFRARIWKKETMFNDPRHNGFPQELGPPLTSAEQGLDGNMVDGKNIGFFQYSAVGAQGLLFSSKGTQRISQTLQEKTLSEEASSPLTTVSTMGGLMLLRELHKRLEED